MAIIYSYPKVTSPLATDVLVLTDTTLTAGKRKNKTKSLAMSDLAAYVVSSTSGITGGGTFNTIPLWTPSGVKIGDSIITQAASGQGVTVTGQLDVTQDFNVTGDAILGTAEVTGSTQLNGTLTVQGASTFNDASVLNGSVTINDQLIDGTGSPGTAGQVLSSTGGGDTAWISDAGGSVTGTGTTNTLPIFTDGPNGVLSDSQIIQTKVDGGTVFDLNAVTTTTYTPSINTKLLDLNSGNIPKFSITQAGGGGVVLPAGGGVVNPGPSFNMGGGAFSNGENSLSLGSATTAFGNGSLAANFLTLASGGGSSAFGLLTEASGLASASFGNKTTASGPYSVASGQDSIASGQSAVAIGEKGDAQGPNTLVQGFGGFATGNNAVKFGYTGLASGNNSAKFGFQSVAQGINSLATGIDTSARAPQSVVTGDTVIVESAGDNSFGGGKNSTITGKESIAYGLTNIISANTCATFGFSNSIPAGGFQSFVVGNNNNAGTQGQQKLIGTYLEGSSQSGVYLGTYNDNTDVFNKFQIGNGTGSGRSNALSINGAGNIKIPTYGSGAVTGTAAYNLSVAADGKIIETASPTVPDYLSFVCLLTQSGAANPQPNLVLENSLGVATPFSAFTRISSGEYNLSATGKFKLLKTIVFINGGSAENNHDVAWEVIDADNLRIRTHNSDGKLTKASLEIRTYN